MNYLAHLFLADDNDDSLLGNLFGDFVKGNPEDRYNTGICDGIYCHRKIDIFADAHPVTRRSRLLFSRRWRRFAGIIVDMCHDHFLSKHWQRFSARDRSEFVDHVYAVLTRHRPILPGRLQRILDFIIDENWLGSYIQIKNVGITLDRIAGRLTRGEQFKGAIVEVDTHYDELERDFLNFFPDLIRYTRELGKYAVLSGQSDAGGSSPQ